LSADAQRDRDRSVVDEVDLHLRAEATRLDARVALARAIRYNAS
jgi:hypothetical protein